MTDSKADEETQDPRDSVSLKIPGSSSYLLDTAFLPPVGTRIELREKLCDNDDSLSLEVTGYEWIVRDNRTGDSTTDRNPGFNITIKTRRLKT